MNLEWPIVQLICITDACNRKNEYFNPYVHIYIHFMPGSIVLSKIDLLTFVMPASNIAHSVHVQSLVQQSQSISQVANRVILDWQGSL